MKRATLVLLALAAPVLLVVQLVPRGWLGSGPGAGPGAPPGIGAIAFALLSVLVPVALMGLGAARGGRLAPPVAWILALLALVLEGAAVAVLALARASAPRLAGLPPAAVAALVGFWLLPLPLVALGYGLTFRRTGPTREDLRRLGRRLDPRLDRRPEAGDPEA